MYMPSVSDCIDWIEYLSDDEDEIIEILSQHHPKHFLKQMRDTDYELDGELANPEDPEHVENFRDAMNLYKNK